MDLVVFNSWSTDVKVKTPAFSLPSKREVTFSGILEPVLLHSVRALSEPIKDQIYTLGKSPSPLLARNGNSQYEIRL